jgi:hypothetical protein
MSGWNTYRVTLDALIAFAWSAPMRELAERTGLSDTGLKKLLRSHGVISPPQGYWNRVHAGRPVQQPPSAPARGPGGRTYVLVDKRLSFLPQAPLPSSAGPFASAKVPEDLEDLRGLELKTIGRAASAAKITVPYPAIRMLLDQDEKERETGLAKQWHTPVLLYESPFEKRRLRILNAVFLTLGRRGHSASAGRDGHQTDFGVTIGNTYVAVRLDDAGRKPGVYNRYNTPPPDPKRSASVKLRLTAGDAVWQDDGAGTLETRIADIAAGLIVEGECAYRNGLREMEEQAERARVAAEQQRQERLRKANADRVTALIESGRLLAEADNLRSLIARVGAAVAEGRLDLSPQQLAEWRAWADAQADRLDPVLSGQVATHLLPPAEV